MIIYNCCCTNSRCTLDCVDVQVQKENEKEKVNDVCAECGKKLKVLGIKLFGGFLKFETLSPAEKKKVLKKRSHEHFKKKLLDQKIEMVRKSDSEAKQN